MNSFIPSLAGNLGIFLARLCFTLILFLPVLVTAQKEKKPKPVIGYASASYSLTASEQYMRDWLIAGPVKVTTSTTNPDEKTQIEFFKSDQAMSVTLQKNKPVPSLNVNGTSYGWHIVKSSSDMVDLDQEFKSPDFVAAYAMAEIVSDKELKTFLSIGSDDGIRIWHNGKLIHDNWIPRGVTKDQDLVPVTLVKGSNQIILKVQDISQGWGFVARLLNKDNLSDNFITAAGSGNIDALNQLLDAGVNVNAKNKYGLTAVANAKVSGREEVVKLLLEKGAENSNPPAPDVLINSNYDFLNGKPAAGIAVLVAKDGKIVYKNAYGYADIAGKRLIKTDTKFRIGSVTKQFTGVAILKLQEEGKISVKDKLSKFYPDFPRGDEVTIHHLLTHTSGIHSYTSKPDFIEKVVNAITEDDAIKYFKNDPYDFNPGEQFRYNNSAYFLLGTIIAKVSGMPYADYLRKTFFEPLGMTNSGFHTPDLKLDNEALGYTKEGDQYKLSPNWNMTWAGGAGALYSTIDDLFKWNEGIFNGKVLNPESLKAAHTSVVLNNGEVPSSGAYGYGWFIHDYRGLPVIEHSGGLHGFISQFARYPKENLTVAVLTNLTPPELNLNPHSIAEYFLWEKMEKQGSKVVDATVTEDVKKYEGRYDFQNGAVMTITSQDNNLFAQLTGQAKFPIFPSGSGEYFWKVVDARIKFHLNEKGEVDYGDFQQNGAKLKVLKLEDVAIVSIDKALYKLYSGRYDYGNNFIITVSTEADKIYAQGSNQPKFEIFPLSETDFTGKEINARLTFVKEPDGKVSKLILDMGGQKKDAPRLE